jgi:hypothetical protein
LYDTTNYHRYRRQIAGWFAKAAAERYTVLRSDQFTAGVHAATAARHTRQLTPGATLLLVAYFDRPKGGTGPPTKLLVTAVRLARDQDHTVVKEEWALGNEEEALKKAADVLKKLAASEGTGQAGAP